MKCLFCPTCQDIVRLDFDSRSCHCGRVGGRYIDESRAEIYGDPIPFGILNGEFSWALAERTDEWPGPFFRGFIIPRNAENVLDVSERASETA